MDEEEARKWETELAAAKTLYNQWREVFALVTLFADTLQVDDDVEEGFTKRLITENLMVVAPRIMSAAGDTLYMIKMENAAVIRFNCRQMMDQVRYAALTGAADKDHKGVIEEAMQKFQEAFRQWVALFKRDEYEDEWGLF